MNRFAFAKWIAVLAVLLALVAPIASPVMIGVDQSGDVALAQEG